MKIAAIIATASIGSACATQLDPYAEFSELSFNQTDSFHIGTIESVHSVPVYTDHLIPNESVSVLKTDSGAIRFAGFCAEPGMQNYLVAIRTFDEPIFTTKDSWSKGEAITANTLRRCKPVGSNTILKADS